MSVPGVINMRNVFHNPAPYNYASLFHNTLALALSEARNTCLFGLFSLSRIFFLIFNFSHHFSTSTPPSPTPHPAPPFFYNDKEAVKTLFRPAPPAGHGLFFEAGP